MQEAGHPQEIERTEEERREAACGFGEIGENCDFTLLRILYGLVDPFELILSD
jgi:hypothetical protein